jgi:hypothetical protein
MAALFRSEQPNLKPNKSDQYIILDSFTKNKDSAITNGQLRWTLTTGDLPPGSSGIRIRKPFVNISAIQAAEFTFPEINSRSFGYVGDTPGKLFLERNVSGSASTYLINQFSHFGRFSISVSETGTQSISGRFNGRHNFEYKTVKNNLPESFENTTVKTIYESIPIRDWDTFNISPPISEMNTITLNFKANDVPIKFKEDCFYHCKADIVNNYVQFTYLNHGLLTGDRIFIEEFESGNSVLDSYMNREEGHLVGGEPGLELSTNLTPGDDVFAVIF